MPKKKAKKQIVEKEFTIGNKTGLHARPAALFVQSANQFTSEIEIKKEDLSVNGKSIMGIMTLAAESGSTILVRIEGPDAVEAMAAIQHLMDSKFGEEE